MADNDKRQRREQINKAIETILVGGQSYKIGSRSLTRADLGMLKSMREDLEAQLDTDAAAETVFQKVRSGTLKTTSVRYRVDRWEIVEAGKTSGDGRFTGPCSIARKWTPVEVSIVSVPADPTVGVGRSDGEEALPLDLWERQIQINANKMR